MKKNNRSQSMKVLVTGGLGFIGSHTVVELYAAGHEAIIVDNLCNSKKAVLGRLEKITGVFPRFYELDCCDYGAMRKVFEAEHIDAIIHFAGLKAVGESVSKPLEYYENNLTSALVVARLMREFKVKNLVFSSSATVYGLTDHAPVTEEDPVTSATNPYGETKVMIERILEDIQKAEPWMNIALLRYFNPIGGHASGLLGEDPNGIPNNLMPYLTQVAIGKREKLHVFGNTYPTPDGTGIRDYIHVVDLAIGHVATLKKLETNPGLVVYNLGTGKGTSVLEMVKAFEDATGVKIPYSIDAPRPGDIAITFAKTDKAERELHWKATRSVADACADAYNFQKNNPNGIE